MGVIRRFRAVPALVLTGAGLVLMLAGGAGVFAGLALADRIHALLPDEITSDAAAIGGAAMALGAALLLAGIAHLLLAAAIRRDRSLVAGIVLCVVMSVIAVGWAVAALVSAAAGSAPAGGMVPAAIGLAGVAAAYAWAAALLMERRRVGRGPI